MEEIYYGRFKVVGYDGNLNSSGTCCEWTYLTDSYSDAIDRAGRYDAAIIYKCDSGFSKYIDRSYTCFRANGDVEEIFNNLPE